MSAGAAVGHKSVSVNLIGAECSALIYMILSCLYYEKAIIFLVRREAFSVGFYVNESSFNYQLFKNLGKKGVQHAITVKIRVPTFTQLK